MLRTRISVITLTKNRAPLLRLCLKSLEKQLNADDEIILLDNGSNDNTRSVVSSFHSLPIKYFYTEKKGYPALYNLAAQKSTKEILVFLDDDCIADASFIESIRQAHKDLITPAVVQGNTLSLPKGNIYAEIMGDHYRNWLSVNSIHEGELKTFDNKNASMLRTLFLKTGGYDETLVFGAEDIEYGLRLRHAGFPVVFNKRIVAYHHERTTLSAFMSQHINIARREAQLDSRLSGTNRIGLTSFQKIKLYVSGVLKRETGYLLNGKLLFAVYLPLLYILLICLRIYGYSGATVRNSFFHNSV